jgi:hypothetical protein
MASVGTTPSATRRASNSIERVVVDQNGIRRPFGCYPTGRLVGPGWTACNGRNIGESAEFPGASRVPSFLMTVNLPCFIWGTLVTANV